MFRQGARAIDGLFANRVLGVEVLCTLPGPSLKIGNQPVDTILTVGFFPLPEDQRQGDVRVASQIFQVLHVLLIVQIVGVKN